MINKPLYIQLMLKDNAANLKTCSEKTTAETIPKENHQSNKKKGNQDTKHCITLQTMTRRLYIKIGHRKVFYCFFYLKFYVVYQRNTVSKI